MQIRIRASSKSACCRSRADGSGAGCEACHSHQVVEGTLGLRSLEDAFALLGAHRATACIDCHKPPNLETKLINVDFKAAPTQCEDCHEDIHGKQFARQMSRAARNATTARNGSRPCSITTSGRLSRCEELTRTCAVRSVIS